MRMNRWNPKKPKEGRRSIGLTAMEYATELAKEYHLRREYLGHVIQQSEGVEKHGRFYIVVNKAKVREFLNRKIHRK